MTPPALSLVMCTIGETGHLPRLAASLARQSRRDFELIVVDQSEPGRLDEFLALLPDWLKVEVVRSPRGLSRARNVGLGRCRAALVALPDDDAWYPDDLIAKIIGLFETHPRDAIISGVTRDEHLALSNGAFLAQPAAITPANVWRSGNSNSIFFRLDAAREAGGFDESLGVGSGTPFGSGEETDFLLRILRAGHTGLFLPDLVVHHDQVDVVRDDGTLKRATLYAQGYGRVLRLHDRGAAFMIYRCIRGIVAGLLAAAKGDRFEARRRIAWTRGIFDGYRAR